MLFGTVLALSKRTTSLEWFLNSNGVKPARMSAEFEVTPH